MNKPPDKNNLQTEIITTKNQLNEKIQYQMTKLKLQHFQLRQDEIKLNEKAEKSRVMEEKLKGKINFGDLEKQSIKSQENKTFMQNNIIAREPNHLQNKQIFYSNPKINYFPVKNNFQLNHFQKENQFNFNNVSDTENPFKKKIMDDSFNDLIQAKINKENQKNFNEKNQNPKNDYKLKIDDQRNKKRIKSIELEEEEEKMQSKNYENFNDENNKNNENDEHLEELTRKEVKNLTKEEKRKRRLLQNRINAKRSRNRKKKLVEDLENEINSLRAESKMLQLNLSRLKTNNERLKHQLSLAQNGFKFEF
ncbi:bzip transcription factor 60-like [Anaeramoeba ignava]|uniref:Bzip transcription factor 60-like n=1 Tax=Anaeramoeba ignava TaxID=1746090 RepID=A0A9Q0RA46_ANAIG|nr:bzip transcription factor 60-like [Anaeramoeba ignava]